MQTLENSAFLMILLLLLLAVVTITERHGPIALTG